MVNADVIIDVFNGAIDCLSSLLSTDVGAWTGGCFIVMAIFNIFKKFQTL